MIGFDAAFASLLGWLFSFTKGVTEVIGGVAAETCDGSGLPAGGCERTAAAGAITSAAVSKATNSAPTATMSPGSPVVRNTTPVTGAGTSTLALSVITSTMRSPSVTDSPATTCHSTISASTIPSPRSGSSNTNSLMFPPALSPTPERFAADQENIPTQMRGGRACPSL